MKHGTIIAAGLAAGYVLGRTRKMRLALTLAAVGATGKLGVRPSEALEHRLKDVAGSDIGKIAETVRGELFTAVKGAAASAATDRIDALTDRVNAGLPDAGEAAESVKSATSAKPGKGRKRAEDEDEDTHPRQDEEPDEPDEDEDEEPEEADENGADTDERKNRPVVRRTSAKRSSGSRRSTPRRRDEDEQPSVRRRQSAGASTGRKR